MLEPDAAPRLHEIIVHVLQTSTIPVEVFHNHSIKIVFSKSVLNDMPNNWSLNLMFFSVIKSTITITDKNLFNFVHT